jgi:dihydropteroate synthase
MGILNVTPDSFSDGGRHFDADAAVARGVQMVSEGADIIDVGGESTRPGAEPVSADEERRRVIPVIRELARRISAVISVDTTKAAVAGDAIGAGARIINDISAMTMDSGMASVARESGAGIVLMHMQGTPGSMQKNPVYADVVEEVTAFLRERIGACVSGGVSPSALAVDPGIGFGKTLDHNLTLLAGIGALTSLRRPVVVGISRKSMLGRLTGCEVADRMPAGIAGMVFCVMKGANIVRVHDVKESVQAIRVVTALRDASRAACP